MNTSGGNPFDFDYLHSLEYVEANGLGGYASSTFSGAHSRKYHGLLVASLKPPVKRVVAVSKMDETILLNDQHYDLGCNQFPGTLYPFGVQYLTAFRREIFPEWTYQVEGIILKKTIAAVYGENTTLVLYEVVDAPEKFTMQLQPFYASRDIHHLARQNEHIGQHYIFEKSIFQTMNYQGCPEFFINVPKSHFIENRVWYNNFEYHQEYLRGLDFKEDLFSHGKFSVTLRKGSRLGIIVSIKDPAGRDAFRMFREEKKRREAIIKEFNYHPQLQRLALAADQFVVQRDDMKTIIAGYPWFTDWGRDTMIALPGLCLVTERLKDAKRILQKFGEYVSEGMIPNRFPDSGERPEYNTIDATLWYFNAMYKYYKYSGDKLFIKAYLPLLRDIVEWHYRGTRYGIQVDPVDNLLGGGQEGTQLTWMDAKLGDWVVTPRRGKAVEINALWYNALCIMDFFMSEFNYTADSELFHTKALAVRQSFNRLFFNESTGALFDCIEGQNFSKEIRPNQIYALSLPFPVLDAQYVQRVLEIVQDHLLTPFGLRSLSPSHPGYKGRYEGNPFERDGAYHQGPVWSHLMGAYIDALFYARGEEARQEALYIVEIMLQNLDEAGLGSISEIFDGDPPYYPKGCVSQAWSVAEILRSCVEHRLLEPRKKIPHTPLFESV